MAIIEQAWENPQRNLESKKFEILTSRVSNVYKFYLFLVPLLPKLP
jgi:hypothetical protein